MATLADLFGNIDSLMSSAGYSDAGSGRRLETRLPRLGFYYHARLAEASVVDVGSNLAVTVATVDIQVSRRAAGSTLAQIDALENLVRSAMGVFGSASWWQQMASVRETPTPDVSFESEPELIGEVLTFTVRCELALEA
jgi:hypothetical protein